VSDKKVQRIVDVAKDQIKSIQASNLKTEKKDILVSILKNMNFADSDDSLADTFNSNDFQEVLFNSLTDFEESLEKNWVSLKNNRKFSSQFRIQSQEKYRKARIDAIALDLKTTLRVMATPQIKKKQNSVNTASAPVTEVNTMKPSVTTRARGAKR